MIRMPLPWLVFTALVIFLAGIVLVWIGYEIARRHREARRRLHWIACRVCSFHFKAETPLGVLSAASGAQSVLEVRPILLDRDSDFIHDC